MYIYMYIMYICPVRLMARDELSRGVAGVCKYRYVYIHIYIEI